MSTACPSERLTPTTAHALYGIGLSVSTYVTWRIVFSIIWMLVWSAVGILVAWHKRTEWYALLVALMCVLQGAISVTNTVAGSPSSWQWAAIALNFLGFFLLFLVVLLFPNGRFVSRWTGFLAGVFLTLSVCYNFFPAVTFQLYPWTSVLGMLLWIGCILTAIATQIYRYRYLSDAVQRQQTKWVVFGFAIGILSAIGATLLLLFPSPAQFRSLVSFLSGGDFNVFLCFIPLTLSVAILRYRLWDIDIVINKTLVYSTLTICIFSIYLLCVAYVSLLFQVRNSLSASLLATGLVAVLFQPLREWLQRSVNRLMYGERDEPYRVISRLGSRLEATLAPEEMLPAIVETVARSLKLPYAAVSLKQDNTFIIATSYGVSRDSLLHLPLTYQAETIGELILAPRVGSESFTRNERQLLQDLGRQAGIALHSVLLTADLERSRQRIVAAREEARRRLGNDLHDGLGHLLAGVLRKVEMTAHQLERDPQAAQQALFEIKQQTRIAIETIRHLAHMLHPPELELLGVAQALRERLGHYDQPNGDALQVTIDAPPALPGLPIAVEAAVYYIALEAVANVYRHAHARHCLLRLRLLANDEQALAPLGMWTMALLELEICDDGCGLPEDCQKRHAGLGLASMRERAAELGGSCLIEPATQGGTRIFARLPCVRIPETGG